MGESKSVAETTSMQRSGATPQPASPEPTSPETSGERDSAFYQVSTLNALMQGNFDGAVTVSELLRHGSWGIGTYEGLDGEAVVCEGSAFCAHADGTTCVYPPDATLAFATVAHLDGRASRFELAGAVSLAEVRSALDDARRAHEDNDNVWSLVALRGSYAHVRVRSCEKQTEKPYPTLPEVARCQREHAYDDERGWVIGVWVPAWMGGVNLPGWHVHFLSEDHERGGHILELAVDKAAGRIESYPRLELQMPHNPEFAALDLTRDLSEATRGVEG